MNTKEIVFIVEEDTGIGFNANAPEYNILRKRKGCSN